MFVSLANLEFDSPTADKFQEPDEETKDAEGFTSLSELVERAEEASKEYKERGCPKSNGKSTDLIRPGSEKTDTKLYCDVIF